MNDRYRITPVTYTTAIYYFMYRFLSAGIIKLKYITHWLPKLTIL